MAVSGVRGLVAGVQFLAAPFKNIKNIKNNVYLIKFNKNNKNLSKMPKNQKIVVCQICKQQKKLSEVLPAEVVRASVAQVIQKQHSDWDPKGFICFPDLNHFRGEYIKNALEAEKGELSVLDQDVLKSMKAHELLTKNINAEFERKLTFGEKISDKLAEFGGSWKFIIFFAIIIFFWISLNAALLAKHPFDPYPFILLNLILSTLAALQAPVIMMSQNRLEARDRLRSEHDYRINLKAELEIRHLHEKMDHLLRHQWQRLLEIQEIQTELMQEMMKKS